MLKTGDGLDPLLRRPFSICGILDDAFLLLYRVVGRGTKVLSHRTAGERLHVLGPLGNGFQHGHASPPLLLVGGGIGLAPLFFLAQILNREFSGRPFALLAGFSTAEEALNTGIVSHLPMKLEIATDDGSAGHFGPVTDLLESRLRSRGPGEGPGTVFACGPPAMLKRVAEITTKAGAACQVSLESAMACGLGACLGCAVKAAEGGETTYVHVCREGPVFPAGSVDWGAV